MEPVASIGQLISMLNDALVGRVAQTAEALATAISPVVLAGLTAAVLYFGLLQIVGKSGYTIDELLYRMLVAGIVVELALTGGWYLGVIIPAALAVPDDLALALVPGAQGSVSGIVDGAVGATASTLNQLMAKAGFFSADGLGFTVAVGLFALAAGACLGVGFGLLVVGKVGLAVLLCLGPLMIPALLFRPLSWCFDGWLRQTMNYSLLLSLVTATLSIIAGLFEFLLAGSQVGQQNMGQLLTVVAVGGTAGLVLLLQLPGICSGIVGGVALSISAPIHRMAAAAQFGGRAVAATGRGAASVGRGVTRTFVTGHPQRSLPAPAGGGHVPTGTGAAAKGLAYRPQTIAKPPTGGGRLTK